jgi:ATP-dependent DNA ligase
MEDGPSPGAVIRLSFRKAHAPKYAGQGSPPCSSINNWKATAQPSSATPARWGLKGIVSKRKDSPYRSGRSPDWLKMKNLDAPAVKRETEED